MTSFYIGVQVILAIAPSYRSRHSKAKCWHKNSGKNKTSSELDVFSQWL